MQLVQDEEPEEDEETLILKPQDVKRFRSSQLGLLRVLIALCRNGFSLCCIM